MLGHLFREGKTLFIMFAVAIFTFFFIEKVTNSPVDTIPSEKMISNDIAYTLWKNNQAIFIDARPKQIYQIQHIPNSYSFPFTPTLKLSDLNTTIFNRINYDSTIIAYCDSKACGLSRNLSYFLRKIGFQKVYVMIGGIEDWQKKGYPVE